jgi:hypothetical protein
MKEQPHRRVAAGVRHRATTIHPVRVTGRGETSLRRRLDRGGVIRIESTRISPSTGRRRQFRLFIRLDVILPILLLALSLGQNLDQVHVSPFFRDEARWIGRSFFVQDLADPFGSTWNDYYLTNTQAPFANYVMGLGLLIQGRDLNVNRIWDFNETTAWNQLNGAMPSAGDMDADRRMNAVIGALVTLCVYFIGRMLGNRFGAFLGASYIAFNPLHILMSSQALADEFLTLTIALIFIAAMRLVQHPSWFTAVALGILIGVGGSAKLSPLFFALPLAGLGVLLLLRSWKFKRFSATPKRDRILGLHFLAQPFIAAFVFVAAYPYLWVDPFRRTYDMFRARTDEMTSQGSIWTNLAIKDPLDVVRHIGLHVNRGYSTTYRLDKVLTHALSLVRDPTVGLDFFPAIAGTIVLGALVVRFGLTSKYGILAILVASDFAVILVGMRADFNRYYLPVILIMAITISVCMSSVWSALARSGFWRAWNVIPGVRLEDEHPRVRPTPPPVAPRRQLTPHRPLTTRPRPSIASASIRDELEPVTD